MKDSFSDPSSHIPPNCDLEDKFKGVGMVTSVTSSLMFLDWLDFKLFDDLKSDCWIPS